MNLFFKKYWFSKNGPVGALILLLWGDVKTLKAATNMPVQLQNDGTTGDILTLINGNSEQKVADGLDPSRRMSLLYNFYNLMMSKGELVGKVFPNIQINYKDHDWLSEGAIHQARIKTSTIFKILFSLTFKHDTVTYKSIDTVVEVDEAVNYPTEFMNFLDLPGMAPHALQLKIGVPITMLRNMNKPKLCNGTQFTVKTLMSDVVEATILTGPFKDEDVSHCLHFCESNGHTISI